MLTKSLMIPDPITVTENASIQEAIEVMKINSIRHLPVVAGKNQLKGFVTMADLRLGLIPSMVGGVTLADLMIKDPITIRPDDDIEIAARLIYKHKIGGMPVVTGKKVVGIITESDILRAFIDMMGILTASCRVDVIIGDKPESFQEALKIINDNGGDVINVGMTAQQGSRRTYFFRLTPCETQPIVNALKKEGFEVKDVMN